MGRPGVDYWRSRERAEIGARELLGDSYEILEWAFRRSKSSLRQREDEQKELRLIADMSGRAERALETLRAIEGDLDRITISFPSRPDILEKLARECRTTTSAASELLEAARSAKELVEHSVVGYQGKYPAPYVHVDFISYALGSIHFAFRNTSPTNPDPRAPGRQAQQRLINEAARGVVLKPRGWALAAIALGIDEPCSDSAEFWERVANRWKTRIKDVMQELGEHGIFKEGGRARFGGEPTGPQNVALRTSSSSSNRPSSHERRVDRSSKKRRAPAAPRK
jgi:hypothetical protein